MLRRALAFAFCAGAIILIAAGVTGLVQTPEVNGRWQACGTDETCLQQVFRETLTTTALNTLLDSIVEHYQSEPSGALSCHSAVHALGRAFAAEGKPAGDLGKRWQICGYGLLHGLYENLPLPIDARDAGTAAYEACETNAEFVSDEGLLHRCYHALGHSIWNTDPQNFDYLRTACGVRDGAGENSCLGGGYMLHVQGLQRDPGYRTPTTQQEWATELDVCGTDSGRGPCVLAYGSLAGSVSQASSDAWQNLCMELVPASNAQCAYLAGQNLLLREPAGPSGALGSCLGIASTYGAAQAGACIDGAHNGLLTLAVPETERKTIVCRTLEGTGRDCD